MNENIPAAIVRPNKAEASIILETDNNALGHYALSARGAVIFAAHSAAVASSTSQPISSPVAALKTKIFISSLRYLTLSSGLSNWRI
jgi:hypothetical protein